MDRLFVTGDYGTSLIKRVQRGVFTTVGGGTNTVTGFLAVDPANTLIVRMSVGGQAAVNDSGHPWDARLSLSADGATLTLVSTTNVIVSWEAREYWPGIWKSIQRGTINPNNTATIAAVDTNRAVVDSLGQSGFAATDDTRTAYLSLTNSTTVTATANTGGTGTIGYQVADPY